MRRVAVIGGGFSGAAVAVALHRRSPHELTVDVFEPSGRVGAGVAYSTPFPYHLLNVPAGNMSADPDRPVDFVEFLQGRHAAGEFSDREIARWGGAAGAAGLAEMFAPRPVYADYVAERFATVAEPSATGVRVRVVDDRVDGLTPEDDGWLVHTGSKPPIRHDTVVLATGNAAPRRLLADDAPNVLQNPWDWSRLTTIDPDHEVLLVGTGLTMVDALLALRDRGHRGRLLAVSNRGLLPRPHRIGVKPTTFHPDVSAIEDPLTWLRRVRRHLQTHPGDDWRTVIDALRPITQQLWHGWSLPQRRSFLQQVRPFWEVHRHRLAPWVAEQLETAITDRQLVVRQGRLVRLLPRGHRIEAEIVSGGSTRPLIVDTVINCTGPDTDIARAGGPLARSLIDQGLASMDPLGLGLDLDERFQLVGPDGIVSRSLFAVGPPCKAARWEITAVPDIRVQVVEVVESVINR
jgi:uncharacterized NAD(P)/FAD-binding protein YdhS